MFCSPTPPPPPPSLPLLVLLIVASHIIASSTATPLIFDCCVHLIVVAVVAVVIILSSSLHPHLVVNVLPFVMSSNGPSCVLSIYSHAAAAAGIAVAVTVAVRRQMQFRRSCKGLCVMPGYIFLLWEPPRLLPPPQRLQRKSNNRPF